MPYVDQGEQEPRPMNLPILPWVAVVAAMGLSILLYWFFYNNLGLNQWLAPLVTGPLIGGAFWVLKSRPIPRTGLVVIIATTVACLAGYVLRHVLWIKWLDPNFQPGVGHAFQTLFSHDMMSVLLIAMSAYLSYVIATIPKSPSTPSA